MRITSSHPRRPVFEDIPKVKLRDLRERARVTNEWITTALRHRGVMLSNNTVSQWLNLRGTRKCSYMHIEMLTSLLEERARLYDLEKVSAISRVKKDYVSVPRAKINFYLDFVKKKKVRRTDLSLAQLAARAEVNEHSLYNWRRYTQTAAKEDIYRVFETVEKIYPDVLGKWRLLSAELGFQDIGSADEKSE